MHYFSLMRTWLYRAIQWLRRFLKRHFHADNPNLPYYITILVAAVFFVVALNAFVEISEELVENELEEIDQRVTDFVVSFRSDGLTSFLTFMTHMGDRYAYLVIGLGLGVILYMRQKSWRFVLQTVLIMALSTISNVVLKEVFNRQRPGEEHLVSVDTLSYPSGHSMSAMAFYGFLIFLTFQSPVRKRIRSAIAALLVMVILLVGLSRIYLGVHYPSDVAAGYMGGLIWVTFCVMAFNIITLYRKRSNHAEAE